MHIIGSSCHLHFSHKRGVFKVNVVATYNDRIDVTRCGNWTLTDSNGGSTGSGKK